MPPEAIADAASVILLRRAGAERQVLMGQRGANAAFMPSKFVFPGGRVDAGDYAQDCADILSPSCRAALRADPRGTLSGELGTALAAAALRELHEETGLALARPRQGVLRFAFRAITPPGRTRRFDARFFLADADDFSGDSASFSSASGELSALQWLPLSKANTLDLPFITQVILAEIAATFRADQEPTWQTGVPFFDNSTDFPSFERL